MKNSYYIQIFVFALVVALMGSFNIYGQDMKSKDLNWRNSKNVQSNEQKRNSNDNPLLAVPLPVVADFENGVFPPTGWSQTGVIWFNYDLISGYGIGTWSAVADFYSVGAGFDDLVTLEYISTGAAAPMLTFDWAYAIYPGATDHLEIYTSTNAGVNWTLLADMYNGAAGANNLNPFNLSQTAAYFPADDQWSTRSIALPSNTTNVKFSAVTDYGNLLWLDNIKITAETFFDNMEAYTVGGQLACQATPVWTTWSLTPCSLVEDPYISSTYAYSGTKSCKLVQNNDLVKDFGGKTTGKWYVNFRFYIPAGKSGYVNLLSDFTPPYEWGLDCYFYADGTGELELDLLGSYLFPYQQGNWNNALFIVDLDTDIAEFWVGPGTMTQIATWDWTQAGAVISQLDAVDFFGAAPTDEMYFDNFYFSDIAPPIPQLSNDAGTESIDLAYQYGPGTVVPTATVKNYGIATNTFNVTMTITGGYTSTKTVTALAPGLTQQVTFDNYTAATGAYLVNVCTQLTGDEDVLNDCKDQSLYIWDESGTWSAGADFPISTYNGIGVSYNDGTTDWLFVIGGNTPSTLGTECYKYNVTTNVWTPIASLPAKRIILSGAAVGNFIYAFGGSDGTLYQSTVYKYDIAGNSWSTVASLPGTIGWSRAVAYNNYIYVAGGVSAATGGIYLNTVHMYNTTTDTWSSASPMPLAVFGGGFARTGNTLVYATGAYESGILNTVMVGTITGNPAVINWAVMDNPYPGINHQELSKYGADFIQEMLAQSISGINNLSDAIPFPGGSLYRTHASPWGSDAIIMAGGTPTSTYAAANPNPCYIYKPATDTWIAQENVPVPIGAHQSGSFQNGSTWKFITASGFGVSAVTSATQIYTQTLGSSTFALSVSVGNGWNMVSAPGLHPTNQNVGTWWPNLVGSVYRYQSGYVSVTTTTPGLGYWMKNNGAQVYSYPSIQIVPHAPIAGASGWNMIGGYEISATASLVTTVPAGLQSGPIYKYSAGYQTATTIDPGYGYWIKLTGAGQIIIPETFAKGEAPVEYFPENWGKIVLTDATGINYTLYAVKGEVNLDQYELPPAPMAEMFDIRFSSGRIAEDINSSMKTIDMSGVTYPVTVRAEGMDMRLMDETGKTVNVNLKSGENVVISDATIQKLMVTGELIPAVYALEQNYPNPFNPSTVIEFSLPEDVSNVKLSIYNALGEKVSELVNTNLVAGKYQYQWNAKNVATGMYIYELRTDKFVSVKKMLLLK